MKIIVGTIVSVLFCMFPVILQANETGTVAIKLNSANIKGSSFNLNVDMDIKINHMYIGKHESLSLTLALKKGNEILYLPPVIINGSNKRKMYERAVNIHGLDIAKGDAYAVLKNDQDLIQFLPYKKSIPYKSWMNKSQLVLIGRVLDYNDNVIDSFTDILEKSLYISNVSQGVGRRTGAQLPKGAVQQSRNTAPSTTASQSTDKVQQYMQRQQQKKQSQQESPSPLRYRQGEYPSQQQNTLQGTRSGTGSQQQSNTSVQQQNWSSTSATAAIASQSSQSTDKVGRYLQQQQRRRLLQ